MKGYFTEDCVNYYDAVTRILKKTQKEKALKFLENDCVEEVKNGVFKVLPIEGYNKTTYMVNIFERDCNCQHATNQKNINVINISCSHIYAVIQYLRRKKVGEELIYGKKNRF